MVNSRSSRQRGITFFGLIFVAVVLALLGVVAAQVTPTLIEFFAVEKAVQRASSGDTPADVRSLFNKSAVIDDIKSITADKLDISKDGDRVVVSFAYDREIHLFGPAFLLLKYRGQSH